MTIKKEIKLSKPIKKVQPRVAKASIYKVNAETPSNGVTPNNILKTFVCGLIYFTFLSDLCGLKCLSSGWSVDFKEISVDFRE